MALLVASCGRAEGLAAASPETFDVTVLSVTDGDTFRATDRSMPPVRVWGIDAPEIETRAGTEASDWLRRRIEGKRLRCAPKDVDRYGRLVAACVLDGEDIAAALIANGHAVEWCRYSDGYYGQCRQGGRSKP